MDNLTKFKEILSSILNASITKYQLLNIAKDLNVNISGEHQNFEVQKKLVQAEVLRHILRDENHMDERRYLDMLEEVQRFLKMKKNKGYSCSFIGCIFKCNQHRDYLEHLKRIHFLGDRFLCNYSMCCKQRFSSLSSLESHVSSIHLRKKEGDGQETLTKNTNVNVSTLCKCNLMSCGKRSFGSVDDLMRHLNSKDHNDERRMCIFEGCDQEFPAGYVSRHHFNRNHKKLNKMKLKPQFLIADPSISLRNVPYEMNANPGLEALEEQNNIEESGEDIVEEETSSFEAGDSKLEFLKKFADFLNKLNFGKMVPQTTIDYLLEEFTLLFSKAKDLQKQSVKKSLISSEVPESVILKIMTVMDHDKIFEAIRKLDSNWKRDKFIKENFKFISPQEIILNDPSNGQPKESFHYISILEGVKNLFEDPSFNKVLEESLSPKKPGDEDLISEISDGTLV